MIPLVNCFLHCREAGSTWRWVKAFALLKERGAIEFAPEARKKELALWPAPGDDFAVMKRVKDMFDPKHLLNRGRLYGRI